MIGSRSVWMTVVTLAAASLLNAGGFTPGHAQTSKKTAPADPNFVSSAFTEIETENLFGFTSGTDIGQPGEKEIGWESVANFGRRDGKYFAAEHKLEFGYTPTDSIHLELGLIGVSTDIKNVTGFEDRRITTFGGVSGELRWLILNRGPGSPIGITLSVEPEFAWVDDGDGSRVRKVAAETKLAADTELVPNRLYLGFNVGYEPAVISPKNGDPTVHESSLNFSSALSFRVVPNVAIGAEVQYMRAYDMGIGLNHFTGDAVFVGPSLYIKLPNKTSLTFAWGRQVRGHSIDEPDQRLNLVDFSRDIGKFKFNFEF
jgi:hypothetical protein